MTKTKTITITVTDREVDAVEDIFFVKTSDEWYEKHREHLHSFWRKLAGEFDKEDE